mmetsp:Transcript_24878/g.49505  ORF Transcript_24878/g.49505 Transcript_24878/m.49505 type:complete len:428 (-) Transcript_24878:83-1366(-)
MEAKQAIKFCKMVNLRRITSNATSKSFIVHRYLSSGPSFKPLKSNVFNRSTSMQTKHVPKKHLRKSTSMSSVASVKESSDSINSDTLRTIFMASAIPMLAFGTMDNFIMVTAGDAIDNTIGASLGWSTMTAAATGQIFSDVSGVLFGGAVTTALATMGWGQIGAVGSSLSENSSSSMTRNLSLSRKMKIGMLGSVVGVTIGCIVGAVLGILITDPSASERQKRVRELKNIIQMMLQNNLEIGEKKTSQRGGRIDAERCMVYFVNSEMSKLWASSSFDSNLSKNQNGGEIQSQNDSKNFWKTSVEIYPSLSTRFADDYELVSYASDSMRKGKTISKCYGLSSSNDGIFKNQRNYSSVMCVPVYSSLGEVIAVIEFVDKKTAKSDYTVIEGDKKNRTVNESGGFTSTDKQLGQMLAHHVSIFIERISNS